MKMKVCVVEIILLIFTRSLMVTNRKVYFTSDDHQLKAVSYLEDKISFRDFTKNESVTSFQELKACNVLII